MKNKRSLFAVPYVGWLALFVVAPIVMVVIYAFSTAGGGFTLENVLGDYGEEERVIEQVSLKEAIKKLPEKEQQVISLRYYHGLTQDKASRVVGVSQVQVSRLEKRAIEKLRLLLEA